MKQGSVKGIRARGDVTVDIDWDACGARAIVLHAGHSGPVTLRSPLFEQPHSVNFDKSAKPRPLAGKPDRISFNARAGESYAFTRTSEAGCAATSR